jgi:hypothetical protein
LNCGFFGSGLTCIGFRTFSSNSAALVSTSAFRTSGTLDFGFRCDGKYQVFGFFFAIGRTTVQVHWETK